MHKRISAIVLSALIAGSGLAFVGTAYAEPVTVVGVLSKIKMAADVIDWVTVEIPAIPEDLERVIQFLPVWKKAGKT